jgi:saccharopine dehydrogenase-like NADP-dependent oxidoreductase
MSDYLRQILERMGFRVQHTATCIKCAKQFSLMSDEEISACSKHICSGGVR